MKRPVRMGKIVLWAVIALFVLAIIVLRKFPPQAPELPHADIERVAVTVLEVLPQRLDDRIVLPGRVEARDDVTVAAEQAGRIVALEVREGDHVNVGDTLARIDERLWQTALRQAELRALDTARDLDRAGELGRDGAISRRALEAAETAAESAQIALEEARVQLSRCLPVAPVDGVIERRYVSEGDYVSLGQPIARLLDLRQVKVIFDLPERDVYTLAVGADCRVWFDALPDQVFTGRVAHVSAAAQPENNAFRVELEADNAEGRILAGLIARVEVVRGTLDDAVILPLQAIVPMEGETVVYVEEDGHAARRIVRLAAIHDSQAIIRTGVRPGERVILDGNRNVLDGTPVDVKPSLKPIASDL